MDTQRRYNDWLVERHFLMVKQLIAHVETCTDPVKRDEVSWSKQEAIHPSTVQD
jgi:hypothetical protein